VYIRGFPGRGVEVHGLQNLISLGLINRTQRCIEPFPDPEGKSSWGQGVYEDIENLSRALQEFKERYNKE
jgi:hypothetical protein